MTKYRIVKDGNGRYFVEWTLGETWFKEKPEKGFVTLWGARLRIKKIKRIEKKENEINRLARQKTVIEEYGDD